MSFRILLASIVVARAAQAQSSTPPDRPAGSAPRDTVHRYGEKILISQFDSVVIKVDTVWAPRAAAPPVVVAEPPAPPPPPRDTIVHAAVITVGTSGMFGGYTDLDNEPGGRVSTRREHHYAVGGVAASVRHESKTWAVGVRGEAFKGQDMAGTREIATGFRTLNASDSAFNTPVKGITAMVDADLAHFGVSAGVVAGDLLNNRNHPSSSQPSPAFAGAIRFGWLNRIYGEASIFDHSPAAIPGPIQKLSLTQLDDSGTRYRIGVTDTGPFIEIGWLKDGWEIAPFASAGENLGFNFSLGVSRRLGIR